MWHYKSVSNPIGILQIWKSLFILMPFNVSNPIGILQMGQWRISLRKISVVSNPIGILQIANQNKMCSFFFVSNPIGILQIENVQQTSILLLCFKSHRDTSNQKYDFIDGKFVCFKSHRDTSNHPIYVNYIFFCGFQIP